MPKISHKWDAGRGMWIAYCPTHRTSYVAPRSRDTLKWIAEHLDEVVQLPSGEVYPG